VPDDHGDTASEIVGRALSLDPGSLLSPPYHDMAMVRADLAAAGFTDFSFAKLSGRSRTGSAQEAAIATCQGGVLRSHIESHAPGRLEEITEAVAAALAEKFGTGPIDAPCRRSYSQRLARLHFSASSLDFVELKWGCRTLPLPMPSRATERHYLSRLRR
jgi:hypothetical protein